MNARDKNFTRAKLKKRMEQIEASIECYLSALERADRREGEVAEAKAARLKDKIASLRDQMRKFNMRENWLSNRLFDAYDKSSTTAATPGTS